jgi:hypothetical protein
MPDELSNMGLADDVWKLDQGIDLSEYLEVRFSSAGIDLRTDEGIDRFERALKGLTNELDRRIAHCDKKGLTPRFRFSVVDRSSLVLQKGALGHSASNSLSTLIKGLPWRTFEKLCTRILVLGGLTEAYTFRGTKDGGLDIFGFLDPSSFLHPAIWRGTRLRVFAQVKKGRLSEGVAKQLETDVHELEAGRGRAYGQLPKKHRELRGPVLSGLFSAKGATRGASEFARAHGSFVVDGERLVELLSHFATNFYGITQGELIDRKAFIESIHSAESDEDS